MRRLIPALSLTAALTAATVPAADAPHPNIVVVLCDDLGIRQGRQKRIPRW